MKHQELCELIEREKIIAIVRKVYGDDLLFLVDALRSAGIRLLEVTFDQSDDECIKKTSNAIHSVLNAFKGECLCGAGTVLSSAQAEAAAQAGAVLIISPNCNKQVIMRTKELGLVSIPGALTPSEIVAAHEYGADFVKVFPAGDFGASYVKSIVSPISHIKLMAVGGVNADNFGDFLNAGCIGAGIGGSLTDRKLITERNREKLIENASKYVAIAHA
jgi:2-dehydro-3-deoxyphosphogluconate aldolase/(4S)-4-hydroxy-2-oxoglutarate aldolase